MKQAINTRTQEEHDALMEWRKSKGKSWIAPFTWEVYREETVIIFDGVAEQFILYGNKPGREKKGYTIIPYTEFAKANIVEEPNWDMKEAIVLLKAAKETISLLSDGNSLTLSTMIDTFLTKHNVTPNN